MTRELDALRRIKDLAESLVEVTTPILLMGGKQLTDLHANLRTAFLDAEIAAQRDASFESNVSKLSFDCEDCHLCDEHDV